MRGAAGVSPAHDRPGAKRHRKGEGRPRRGDHGFNGKGRRPARYNVRRAAAACRGVHLEAAAVSWIPCEIGGGRRTAGYTFAALCVGWTLRLWAGDVQGPKAASRSSAGEKDRVGSLQPRPDALGRPAGRSFAGSSIAAPAGQCYDVHQPPVWEGDWLGAGCR